MIVYSDCRHYKGNMPCDFHKKDGRMCEGCQDYEPIETRAVSEAANDPRLFHWFTESELDPGGGKTEDLHALGRSSREPKERVLIVKLAAVGDVLRTTSILPAVKKKYPSSEVTWVTKANAAPLFAGNTLVDRLIVVEGDAIQQLRRESFDASMCLDADPLSASIHSGIVSRERFGFVTDKAGRVQPANDLAREWWHMGLNDELKKKNRKTYQQIIYEICSLALPPSIPLLYPDHESTKYADLFALSHRLQRFSRLVGVNTGAGARWQYKRWTLEGYAELICKLCKEGVGLVLFGGPEESGFNNELLQRVPTEVVDAGCGNSLRQFIALLNLMHVIFTPDSLGMHIGIALGKHLVVSVGPTSPWELDLFGKGEVIHSDIECLVCYLERCPKTVNCMNTLGPDYVCETIMKYL